MPIWLDEPSKCLPQSEEKAFKNRYCFKKCVDNQTPSFAGKWENAGSWTGRIFSSSRPFPDRRGLASGRPGVFQKRDRLFHRRFVQSTEPQNQRGGLYGGTVAILTKPMHPHAGRRRPADQFAFAERGNRQQEMQACLMARENSPGNGGQQAAQILASPSVQQADPP